MLRGNEPYINIPQPDKFKIAFKSEKYYGKDPGVNEVLIQEPRSLNSAWLPSMKFTRY